jgi:hypothetical protein
MEVFIGSKIAKAFLKYVSLILCLYLYSGCATTSLKGSFVADGDVFSQKEFQPTHCYSGDREYFFGVDLTSKTDPMQVRILQDPVQGTFVKVTQESSGGHHEILFDSSSCKSLEGVLKQTKWEVNEIRDMSGELEMDCTVSGVSVKGKIIFNHCH